MMVGGLTMLFGLLIALPVNIAIILLMEKFARGALSALPSWSDLASYSALLLVFALISGRWLWRVGIR
jgi:hypothetical protein